MPDNIHNISGPSAPKPKPKITPKDPRQINSDPVKAQEVKDHVELSTPKTDPHSPKVSEEQVKDYVEQLMKMDDIPAERQKFLDEVAEKYSRGDYSLKDLEEASDALLHDLLPPPKGG